MSNIKLWAKQNSPELLLGAAILTSTIAVGSACASTYNLATKVLPKMKVKALELHNNYEALSNNAQAAPEDVKKAKREMRVFYVKSAGKILLTYAPAILSLGLSIASMVGSHNIMKGRNIAMATAFTSLKTSYDLYRGRVRAKIGEKAEAELFENTDKKEISIKDENGKTIKKVVDVPKENNDDITQIMWGPGCEAYDPHCGSANISKLLFAQEALNGKLRSEGVVFLSDVYRALGIRSSVLGEKRIAASRVVIWTYDPDNPNSNSYIDFGLYDRHAKDRGTLTQKAKEFSMGLREFITLTFNFDGTIFNNPNFAKLMIRKDKTFND